MRDLETGSLWSHILGRCMKGELEGEELSFVPGTITTWNEWKLKFPETTVLRMTRKSFDYQRFAFSEPSNYVIGIKVGQIVKAYTFAYLSENPIVQEVIAGTPIVLAFDPVSTRAFVFDRDVDDETITFEDAYSDGALVDQETGSRWDPWSGEATAGERKGESLSTRYGIISFRKSWALFYPGTEIVDLLPTEDEL
jgi:hypothetical protein